MSHLLAVATLRFGLRRPLLLLLYENTSLAKATPSSPSTVKTKQQKQATLFYSTKYSRRDEQGTRHRVFVRALLLLQATVFLTKFINLIEPRRERKAYSNLMLGTWNFFFQTRLCKILFGLINNFRLMMSE